ncbi:MAG TPA: FAD-dependent oxidoreductase [Miltoncostaeaceae bacterium]|nr:FAD-dependent oxidoreductase [Miltoncostaeaceae bacterium]
MTGPLVVIGGDAAGMSAAAEARRRDPARPVVVLERSAHVSYSACGLPYWLGRVVPAREHLVALTPEEARDRRGIDVRTGCAAEWIDPEARRVGTSDGAVGYGALIVATGARPVPPPVPGVDTPGVHLLRSMDSAIALDDALARHAGGRVLLVGSGPIGLEMAHNLCRRGFDVHLVEAAPRLVPGFPEEPAARVEAALEAGCATARTGHAVVGLAPAGGGVEVRLRAGAAEFAEEYDLVLLGTGVAPRAELAAAAGCALGAAGAVRVDRRGRTSVPGVWAAGDCATSWHRVAEREVWTPTATVATRAGRVAARDACAELGGGAATGDDRPPALLPGVLGSWVSEAFGLGFGATGLDDGPAREAGFAPETVTRTGRDRSGYMPGVEEATVRLVYDGPTGRLLGGQAVGGHGVASRLHAIALAVAAGMTVDDLAAVDLAYAPPLSPLRDPLQLAAGAVVGDAA